MEDSLGSSPGYRLEDELVRSNDLTPEGVVRASKTRAAFLRQAGLGAGALLGGGALLAFPSSGLASGTQTATNDTQTILNVATSGEVLATIVTTVGFELGLGGDAVTQRTIGAAAREELIHYQVLVASGGMPASKQIWVPDAVFANRTNFLSTIEVGDQIFINAYLIATLTFGNAGNGTLATVAAEFMGVEGVHRALARQALGKLGNDRVFMKLDDPEGAPDSPNRGTPGFCDILTAVSQLQAAGFGFGQQGSLPGKFYDFDAVSAHTPDDPDINQRAPDTCDCECTTHDHSSGHGTNPPTSTPGTSTTTPATTTHTPTASTTPTTTTPTAPHQSDHHHAG